MVAIRRTSKAAAAAAAVRRPLRAIDTDAASRPSGEEAEAQGKRDAQPTKQPRLYAVQLTPNPELPVSLFDPKWQQPEIAQKVAFKMWDELSKSVPGGLIDEEDLPEQRRFLSERRAFTFVRAEGATRFAGSYGELHRHYSLGGARPSSNFHAQAVSFGVDEDGHFVLAARVGCWDGPMENTAVLSVRFFAGETCIGAVCWSGDLVPRQDINVGIVGQSDRLKAAYADIDGAEVVFTAAPGQY
jgi:hypothetical protein